jgi:hypothetical protein
MILINICIEKRAEKSISNKMRTYNLKTEDLF